MSKRILLVGVGPAPDPNAERLYAPALRLWAMTHTLLRAGHHVLVAEAGFGEEAGEESSRDGASASAAGGRDAFARPRIARVDLRWQHADLPLTPDLAAQGMREIAAEFRPDAIVTTTDVMALAAARSRLSVPLYVDYFGEPMAERQAQGAVHDSDAALYDAWAYLLPVLLRADRFSVCSKPQRYALLGQLGAAGRLNRHTCYHDLVDVIPQGLSYESHIQPSGTFDLRGKVVPPEATVVLFLGGYNTWVDENGLFAAMEEAMSLDPTIHYVSTGGAIEGHNTVTFERFRTMVENSRFRHRFHFLGWIPTYQVGDVCDQANIALNLDRWTHEAEFGLRNRIYLWMVLNTAVVTTALSEEIRMFADRKLVRAVPCGDPHAVSTAVLDLARHPDARALMTRRAQDFIVNEYSFERLMKPLRDWAESPSLAPDRLAALGQATRTMPATPRPATPTPSPGAGLAPADTPPVIAVENPLVDAQSRFLDMESVLARERQARQQAEQKLADLQGSKVGKLFKSVFKK